MISNRDVENNAVNLHGDWQAVATRAYLAGLPHTRALWSEAERNMPTTSLSSDQAVEMMLLMLDATLAHPLALVYPRDVEHAIATLRWIKQTCINKRWHQHYCLIDNLVAALDSNNLSPKKELTYKTYVMHDCLTNNASRGLKSFQSVIKWYKQIRDTFKCSQTDHFHDEDFKCWQNYSFEGDDYKCSRSDHFNEENGTAVLTNKHSVDFIQVTLLESIGGITSSTTGLTSWGGSAVMSQWLENNKQIISGKALLELGSGVGFMAGVVLSCMFKDLKADTPPTSYTCTDCHPQVLEVLRANLHLINHQQDMSYVDLKHLRDDLCNILSTIDVEAGSDPLPTPWLPASPITAINGVPCQVAHLDWRAPEYASIPPYDVILASDVVYAQHLMLPLATLLRGLLCRSSRGAVAYLACTRRNSDTMASFLQILSDENLNCSLVYQATLDTHSALFVYNEGYIPVKIYKITL